jgi:hypothetical protein
LGAARLINPNGLNGGLAYGIHIGQPWKGVNFGLSAAGYDLGQEHSRTRYSFSGNTEYLLLERSQSGWYVGPSISIPLWKGIRVAGLLGYYRLNSLYASEIRDSTGNVIIRPKSHFGGNTGGLGTSWGLQVELFHPAEKMRVGLELMPHVMIFSSGEEGGGLGLFYFLSGGLRLTVRP